MTRPTADYQDREEIGSIIQRGLQNGVLSLRRSSIAITLDCKNYEEAQRWFARLEQLCAPRWASTEE